MNLPSSGIALPVTADLAVDQRSLDALRRDAERDPQVAVKKAAQQFEALFMQMVLKSMREATPKSGMFDSSGQDLYSGMLDQQVALKVAESGTGLADVIARQLTRHMKSEGGAAAATDRGDAPEPMSAPRVSARSGARQYAEQARVGATPVAGTDPAARPARADLRPGSDAAQRVVPAPGAAATSAGALAAAGGAGAPGNSPQRNFVTRHWDSAEQASRITGIPTQFILSQAALESGWGRGEIRDGSGLPSHNLFGIKATGGWQGRTVSVVTTEYDNGVPKKVVEKFRAYNNYSEAFRDWAQLLASNPRYADVVARGGDAAGFAHGLQRAGYATDPRYGDKLTRVIASVDAALRRG